MYYKTQIQSTGKGYAFDTQGKKLFFIGNFPCQAGDFVYTDGKYIFGNLSPKAAPTFPVQGGIPVLAIDLYDEISLRGYFNSSAVFKDYDIALDSFIVNDKNKFLHGAEFFIDAEISESGELFTAYFFGGSAHIRNGNIIEDGFISIKKDGKEIKNFSLSSLAGTVLVTGGSNYDAYISLDLFKFDRLGNWSAFISVGCTTRDETPVPPNVYVETTNLSTGQDEFIPFQDAETPDTLAEQITQAILDTGLNYRIITGDQNLYDWIKHSPFAFNVPKLFNDLYAHPVMHIETAEFDCSFETVSDDVNGVAVSGVSYSRRFIFYSDGSNKKYFEHINSQTDDAAMYFVEYVNTDPEGSVGTAGNKGGSHYSIDVSAFISQLYYEEGGNPGTTYYVHRNYIDFSVPSISLGIKDFQEEIKIPVQDGFYILTGDVPKLFDENNQLVLNFNNFGRNISHFRNFSIAKLSNQKYLLGIHGGELFLIQDGQPQKIIDEGLKNFRLRELKNISKAKR